MTVTLQLLTRPYCHLCEEMAQALREAFPASDIRIETVDVDSDPDLISRFDELVPVLLANETVLCFHRLDRTAVSNYLEMQGFRLHAKPLESPPAV